VPHSRGRGVVSRGQVEVGTSPAGIFRRRLDGELQAHFKSIMKFQIRSESIELAWTRRRPWNAKDERSGIRPISVKMSCDLLGWSRWKENSSRFSLVSSAAICFSSDTSY
jgi:hypothetical protein